VIEIEKVVNGFIVRVRNPETGVECYIFANLDEVISFLRRRYA